MLEQLSQSAGNQSAQITGNSCRSNTSCVADCAMCMLFGQAAFESTRANLLPRPWAVDDLDAVLEAWQRKHYSKALLFVDNAGSDVVLGALIDTGGPCDHICM